MLRLAALVFPQSQPAFGRIARLAKTASDQAFLQSILTDVTAVEDDYWELVFALDNISVQQQAVDLAQRLYDDNRRQVDVGTMAPISIGLPESARVTSSADETSHCAFVGTQSRAARSALPRPPVTTIV